MSTETKNYKFIKPDLTDPADIRVINNNFDKLDDMIFRSGEVANHIADPNAHSNLFSKYLPLEGGTMTGKLIGTSAEFKHDVKFGQGLIFSDSSSSSLLNGYDKAYGASVTLYGNDITSGYTDRKNQLWLESKLDANTYSRLYLSPVGGITISTSGSTSKYALYCPSIGTGTIYSNNNNLNFLESYNGNCSMKFVDLGSNQYIQLKVKENLIDIKSDGVYYNDMPSVIVAERSGDINNWYVKYNDGTMLQGGIITNHTSSLSFPQPFVNTNYTVIVGALTNDYQYGGAVFGYKTRLTTGLDGLFCSVSNNTTSYPSWYAYGNNPNHNYILRPHWMVRGDWK